MLQNSAHSTSDAKSSPTTDLRPDTISVLDQSHHPPQLRHLAALPHPPLLLIGYTTSMEMGMVTVLLQDLVLPNQRDVQVLKKRRNRDLR